MHIVLSNPRILVVTLEYLGDIRVLVDVCLKVLFLVQTLGLFVTLIGTAQ